jgi:dolichyl-phosphate-mannose-protein mannosyltransferase
LGSLDYRLVPDHVRRYKINPISAISGLAPDSVSRYASAMSQVAALGRETCTTNSAAEPLVPEHSRSELLIALAVFFCACLYLWPLRNFVTFAGVEGFTLVGAERILRGQIPYRDFSAFYTLGSFYQTAILFKLFGDSLAVARTALLAYAGIFAAITYLLTRRIYGRSAALFAAAMLIFGCIPTNFMALHNWDSTLLALLAIYCAQRLLDAPNHIWSFFLGFTTALTLLTEESKGAGLLLGLGIAAVTLSLLHCNRQFTCIENICSAAAGFAIPSLLTLGYFASKHAAAAMLETCLWPLRHYSVVNRVTYGFPLISAWDMREIYTSGPWGERIFLIIFTSPLFLIPALALLVVAVTLYSIVLRCNTGTSKALDVRVLGGCIFFGVFLATLATRRTDTAHLQFLTPLFMYLVPSLLDIKHPSVDSLYRARPVVACLLLFSFTCFGMVKLLKAWTHTATMETRRGMVRVDSADEIIRYVQDNVGPGQHLYVHPYQPFYSYMTGTVNPTRFDFLQPGMATADQYQSAIHDLATDQTPVVLLDTAFADTISQLYPSTPLRALVNDPVADYILKHYRICQVLNSSPPQHGIFYFMVRTDLSCPAHR